MATTKKKEKERNYITSISDLLSLATQIGTDLDNLPVTLDRGNYVSGTLSFGF